MIEPPQIEENYNLNRSKKLNRRAYKVILRSKIEQERGDFCRSLGNVKTNFSFSNLAQSLFSSGQLSNLVANNNFLKIFTSHPYLSLYIGKGILSFIRAKRKSTLVKVILIGLVAKKLYSRYRPLNTVVSTTNDKNN